jgi:predicted O-linked N-acetylglucosamine transferase (SPINDLY family)
MASLGDHANAVESLRQLVALQPDYGQGHHNLARSLYELGQVDQALEAFQRAFQCLPTETRALPLTNMAMVIPGAAGIGNREILECRRAWATQSLTTRQISDPFRDRDSRPDRFLRLGYLSSYFDKRNWMKPVWGLINHHDRSRFEIHLFSDGPDPSNLEGYCSDSRDRFHESGGLSNAALVQLIEEEKIDFLIELNGYCKPLRLGPFALRAAPIQVAWFGMFATSGLSEIDYLVGDNHVVFPEEESYYTEQIVRVPGSYLTFEVAYAVPAVSPLPCLSNGFLTFGCLAPQYKITTEVIEAWSSILRASPTSRLVLKNVVLGEPTARDFVRGLFVRFAISPARLDLEGPAEHYTFLERYAGIDLALDTFPYNGGTTTMEALWQGVPVLCFTGDRWASRISASLLREAGLPEFVAPDLESHISQAVALAQDPDTPTHLESVRTSMRERLRSSRVCDVTGFARHMEDFYRAIWQRWCERKER